VKKKTRILVIILLLAVIGGGYGYSVYLNAERNQVALTNDETSVETAVARVGELTIYASGAGQVVPSEETALGFDEQGELIDLLVSVGDEVAAGDVLARLQIDKTASQLAAEIASAELAVIKAQQELDSLYETAQMDAAEALVALETAQNDLENLLDYDLERAQAMQSAATAQQTIEDTDMTLYIYNSVPSDDAIYTVYASLLFVEKQYNELKDRVDDIEFEIKSAPNKMVRDRYKEQLLRVRAQLLNKQIEYENAQYRYDTMRDPADPLKVAVAEAQMTTAQAQLGQAAQDLAKDQNGPPAGDVAMAQARLTQAQAEWERLKDGPDPEEILLAETRLSNAKLDLSILQQEQLVVELLAPIDGTVISVDVSVGEKIGGQTVLTLAALSQPLVEVYLDETDYDKVQVGNPVEVVFDALPESTFTGSIVEMDPGLVSVSGSQAIRALAILDQTSYAKPTPLPIGSNASVDVIAGRAEGAVLVPVEALHKTDSGEYVVYVQNNGESEIRPVEVGIMDFTSAEIVNGLSAGEVVAIGNIDK
jgi:HlyD family secretion protein